jgi:hypothetical protein
MGIILVGTLKTEAASSFGILVPIYQSTCHILLCWTLNLKSQNESHRNSDDVERMPKVRSVKKLFKNIPEEKRSIRKPRKRWLDDTENGVKKMDVTGLRKTARDKDAWKLIVKEAKVSNGQYSQHRRNKVMCNGLNGP